MMDHAPQLSDFEGLIVATAARYAPILVDEGEDDIRQILRVKVWQALQAYDIERRTGARPKSEDVEAFVFGCMYNRVKDLLKSQERRNTARNGRQLYIEDQDERGAFEAAYLRVEEEAALQAQTLELPSTLTVFERRVVVLLVAGFNQTEASAHLEVTRKRIREARAAVQAKLGEPAPAVGRTPVAA